MRSGLCALLLLVVSGIGPLDAQTTVTLSTSANPTVYGQPLTLTATLIPTAATGKVTFYDGAAILGTSTVSSGKAVLSTEFVQAGNRSLRAYYAGDGAHSAATSPIVAEKITTATSNGFVINNIPSQYPVSAAAADFNGDGKADLVMLGFNTITVWLGNGDGTFKTGGAYPYSNTGGYAQPIVVSDFNLDGKTDIAYLSGQNSIAILMGNGDGTFQPPIQIPGLYLESLAVGDFNGDGKPDLAYGWENDVSILLGNGDGTFQYAGVYVVVNGAFSIATGDFNGDGKTDLAVGTYGTLDIFLGNGDGSFRSPISTTSGTNPSIVTVADFNGDGKLDVVVGNDSSNGADAGTDNTISVLIGKGDGTFQPPVSYASALAVTGIAVCDFNGDGKPDLAIANYSTNDVTIMPGKGDGTFGPPLRKNLGSPFGFAPMSIAVADFNGDGLVDIATPTWTQGVDLLMGSTSPDFALSFTQIGTAVQGQTNLTYVLSAENLGFMTFSAQVQLGYSMGAGMTVAGIQSPGWTCSTTASGGTCNRGDSLPSGQSYTDITLTVNVSPTAPYTVASSASLTLPPQTTPQVSVTNSATVLQAQTITFPAIPNHTYGDSPFSINVSASSRYTVTVLTSGTCSILGSTVTIDGAGTCSVTASQAGTNFWAPAPTITHRFSISGQSTSVALNASPGSSQLGKPVTLTATITPRRTSDRVTFYDGTAIVGIAPVVSGIATLTTSLLSPGKHSLKAYYGGVTSPPISQTVTALAITGFVSPSQALPNATGRYLAIGDFNGDGHADVAVSDYTLNTVTVMLGNGDGTFSLARPAYTGFSSYQQGFVAVSDFNGDGKADLVVCGSTQFAILLGNGDGTFQNGIIYSAYSKIELDPFTVVVADFNGDGKPDLVLSGSSFGKQNTIDIVLGNGDGTFGTPLDLAVPSYNFSLLAADFNGDGIADLAVLGASSIDVLLGNGDGTFQPAINIPAGVGLTVSSFAAADFNNDGKLDIAFTNGNVAGLLLGNGDGTFRSENAFPVFGEGQMLLSDFNQDQKLDLVMPEPGNVNYLPGNGDGTFGAAVSHNLPITGANVYSVASTDFNGDGRPDLAVGMNDGTNIGIALGSIVPILNISLTHIGNFTMGQTNATYTISVQNTGMTPTTSTVTVNGTFPNPLAVQSMAGSGWTCSAVTVQCTRSDSLAPDAAYPVINVAVNVTSGPATVVGTVTVSGGGGAASAYAYDNTTILASYLKITTQPVNAVVGTALSPVVVQVQDSNGNVVTSFNGSVSLTSNPFGVNATVTPVNGIATFNNMVLNVAGTYVLTASSGGIYGAVSNSFTISVITTATISGQVTASGLGLSGATINVSGSQTASATTDAFGNYAIVLSKNGTYTVTAVLPGYTFSAPVTFSNLIANQTANFTAIKIQNQIARAVFRDANGAVQMITYPSAALSDAGGVFSSDPSAAEDASGNVLVTARDTSNSIWANTYNVASSTWVGWTPGGGIIQGMPSIAADTTGKAWIASRDTYNSYWLASYTSGGGFGGWIPLLGVFSTDPAITSCSDGSIYLIGKDNYNSLWSAHYIPGTAGFQGWQFGGGIIKGNPAATCGSDNAVYVVAEDTFNSNWMARVAGNAWTGWYYGGAITSAPPKIAALGNGMEAVVILDSTNVVWRTTFTEFTAKTGVGWQPWTQVGGVLQDVTPAVVNGQLYCAGKAPNGDLWWWQQTGSQWTWIGNSNIAMGQLSATPR